MVRGQTKTLVLTYSIVLLAVVGLRAAAPAGASSHRFPAQRQTDRSLTFRLVGLGDAQIDSAAIVFRSHRVDLDPLAVSRAVRRGVLRTGNPWAAAAQPRFRRPRLLVETEERQGSSN